MLLHHTCPAAVPAALLWKQWSEMLSIADVLEKSVFLTSSLGPPEELVCAGAVLDTLLPTHPHLCPACVRDRVGVAICAACVFASVGMHGVCIPALVCGWREMSVASLKSQKKQTNTWAKEAGDVFNSC